jgi:DUF177 domain-containing protein
MPLRVNLRHLEAHNVRLNGELAAAELDLDTGDEMIRAEAPLRYDLEVQQLEHSLLIQGRLRLALKCQCVRCLKPFELRIELMEWTRHLPLEGEERALVVNDCVDLTPFVREDILLEFPQHPLCKLDCGGLPKPHRGKAKKVEDLKPGSQKSSAWAELDKLKF